jgi:uncharacterized membrane protein (DUF2068 family)
MPKSKRSPRRVHRRDRALAGIAVFKFAKVALLLAFTFGAMEMLRPDVSERAQEWLGSMALNSDHEMFQRLLAGLAGLTDRKLEILGVAAFLYAVLYSIEGVGLWMGRRWAEYLTVIATSSFVPFEIYELARRLTWIRLTGLIINVAVAVYLIYRLKQPQKKTGS